MVFVAVFVPVTGLATVVLTVVLAGFIVEFSLGANPMIHDLSRAPVVVQDGTIAVPDGPGLGLDMDTDVIARYARS